MDGDPWASLDASLDVEIQQALLRRRHPLIDLALARFTNEDEIALELFRRDADVVGIDHEERERSDSALKLAVLANKMLANPFHPVPGPLRLVGDHVSWLGTASSNEIAALFNNPTLGDGFLREFLEGSDAWSVLSDEHRRTVVFCLSRNANLRREREDSDGSGWYERQALHHACWALAETSPVTDEWALALSYLYEKLPPNTIKGDASRWLDAATRWVSPDGKKEDDRWDHFRTVRFHLARLVITRHPDICAELLTHGDIAMRSAAYGFADLAQEQLAEAFKRDKELAYDELARNEGLWKSPQTRDILRELERKARQAVKAAGGDSFYTFSSYSDWADAMRKKHPHWFAEDGTEDEVEPELPAPSDEPASKADLRTVAEMAMKTRNEVQALLPEIEKLGATVDGVRRDLIFLVGVVAFIVLLQGWCG